MLEQAEQAEHDFIHPLHHDHVKAALPYISNKHLRDRLIKQSQPSVIAGQRAKNGQPKAYTTLTDPTAPQLIDSQRKGEGYAGREQSRPSDLKRDTATIPRKNYPPPHVVHAANGRPASEFAAALQNRLEADREYGFHADLSPEAIEVAAAQIKDILDNPSHAATAKKRDQPVGQAANRKNKNDNLLSVSPTATPSGPSPSSGP